MSENDTKQQPREWSVEGYEKFLEMHPEYPIPEPIECLNLLMKKENALAIINGEKTVDFRAYTQHYCDRLYDKKTEDYIERHKTDPEVLFWSDSIRDDIERIHFHDRNNMWSLDVECTSVMLIAPTDEGIEILHEDFNCHEMDEMHRKLKREGAEDYPLFFAFGVGKILDRKNI